MILSPFLGALIGYITNWVAIKMLFRPHTEKRLLGLKLPFTPGMIPKRRYILAKKTARTIGEYLLTDETLVKHLCSENVKNNIEGIIDGVIEDAKRSEKTIGSLLLGEADDGGKLSDFFSGFDLTDSAKKLDEKMLGSNAMVRQVLPDGIGDKINVWLSGNVRNISEKLIDIIESPFFEGNVKPVITNIIRQNIKGLASLFVLPESVYDNFYNSLNEYLKNPINDELTAKRLEELLDWLLEAKVSDLATVLADESGNIAYAFIEKLDKSKNSDNTALIELYDSLKSQSSQWIASSLSSIKIGSLVSKIDQKQLIRLKQLLMDGYEDFVRNNIPSVLAALDVSAVIEEKINEFEMAEAENIVLSVVEKELKTITYFGGLLGFVIGLTPPLLELFGV